MRKSKGFIVGNPYLCVDSFSKNIKYGSLKNVVIIRFSSIRLSFLRKG